MTTLSVLIPTKNRSEYLDDVLSSILKWDRMDFEIVIQDNSDDNKTQDVVSKYLRDSRVKYFFIREDLSVIDNFENAVKNSSGAIITAIGDDDGILPIVMDISDWMLDKNVDAVLTDKADYVWPDLLSRYNSSYNNSKIKFSKDINKQYNKIEPLKELMNVCKHGGTTMGMLPRIYYGLVNRKSLDEVHNITGQYFPGPSPDMANAVSLSLVVKDLYYLRYPAFIAGSSSKSTAGLGLKRKHVGSIGEIKHLPKNTLDEWDKLIPLYWSGPTIWAQSASIVMKKMGCKYSLDYDYLYARCLVFFPQHFNLISEKIHIHGVKIKNYFRIMFFYLYNWNLRLVNLMPKLMKKLGKNDSSIIIVDNQLKISEAVETIISYTSKCESDKL